MTNKKPDLGKAKTILMPDKSSHLIFIDLSFKFGSVMDPPRKGGLASLTLSMLLRGTQKYSSREFHELLDEMGAEIYLSKHMESLRISGEALAENIEPFFDLLHEMLHSPAFSENEFTKLKAQTRSVLQDELGIDSDIAGRRFQEYCLAGHPYSRMTSGSLLSLENISIADVRNFYKENFSANIAVFGATGACEKKRMENLAKNLFDSLPGARSQIVKLNPPQIQSGRNVLLLDKPDRSQSQIYLGSKGISYMDPDYHAALVAAHIFSGGSFSAWLMHEIRAKRGWSYGAYGWFHSSKQPLYFGMHTTPSNKDTVPAVKLILQLLEKFARKGVTKQEFEFSRKSLVNQAAFQQDTPKKRLNNKVSAELLGLPSGFYDQFQAKLRQVSYGKVQQTIKKHFNSKDLFLMILGTVAAWEPDLRAMKGFASIRIEPYDREPDQA